MQLVVGLQQSQNLISSFNFICILVFDSMFNITDFRHYLLSSLSVRTGRWAAVILDPLIFFSRKPDVFFSVCLDSKIRDYLRNVLCSGAYIFVFLKQRTNYYI